MGYQQRYEAFLKEQNFPYQVVDQNLLFVGFQGENLEKIRILIDLPEQGNHLRLICPGILPFMKDVQGMVACNTLNQQYRFIKFFINSDHLVEAWMDLHFTPETFEQDCTNFIEQFAKLLDECYVSLEELAY